MIGPKWKRTLFMLSHTITNVLPTCLVLLRLINCRKLATKQLVRYLQRYNSTTSRLWDKQRYNSTTSRLWGKQRYNSTTSRLWGKQRYNSTTSRLWGKQRYNSTTSRLWVKQIYNSTTFRLWGKQRYNSTTSRLWAKLHVTEPSHHLGRHTVYKHKCQLLSLLSSFSLKVLLPSPLPLLLKISLHTVLPSQFRSSSSNLSASSLCQLSTFIRSTPTTSTTSSDVYHTMNNSILVWYYKE